MADNLFLIASKQLRQADFSGYVLGVLQGSFNSLLGSYIQTNGYLGNNVLYLTGDQVAQGNKTFLDNLSVRYSGISGSAPSQQFVLDQDFILQSQINSISLFAISGAHLTGVERFVGQKYLEGAIINSGMVTGSLSVPTPFNSGDAVPLIYLQNQISIFTNNFLLNNSGNQNVSGILSFFNGGTAYVPIATNPSGAISLSQLDATGNNILNLLSVTGNNLQTQINSLDLTAAANVTGFGGVLSFNAQLGNIFSQGRGTVSCTQNGNIFNISGHTLDGYTGAFLGYTSIVNGNNQQFISYSNNYSVIPYVFTQLENSSGDPILNHYVSGRTTSGFHILLSSPTTTSNYNLSYIGFTGTGSIVNVIQGPQGLSGLQGLQGNPGVINSNLIISNYFNSLSTGLAMYETFIPNDSTISPFFNTLQINSIRVSCVITGSGSINLTGNVYKRDNFDSQTNLIGFNLNAGTRSNTIFCDPIYVDNSNIIGMDILAISSGCNKVSVSVFGNGL